jgi:hypothetical protein
MAESDEIDPVLKHVAFIGGSIFFAGANIAVLLVPVTVYGYLGLRHGIPKGWNYILDRRRRAKAIKPMQDELKQQIEKEKEELMEEAQKQLSQRLARAALIDDPMLREHEQARAKREFAKVMKEING